MNSFNICQIIGLVFGYITLTPYRREMLARGIMYLLSICYSSNYVGAKDFFTKD